MLKKDLRVGDKVRLENGYWFMYQEQVDADGEVERYFVMPSCRISLDTYQDSLAHKKYKNLCVAEVKMKGR